MRVVGAARPCRSRGRVQLIIVRWRCCRTLGWRAYCFTNPARPRFCAEERERGERWGPSLPSTLVISHWSIFFGEEGDLDTPDFYPPSPYHPFRGACMRALLLILEPLTAAVRRWCTRLRGSLAGFFREGPLRDGEPGCGSWIMMCTEIDCNWD